MDKQYAQSVCLNGHQISKYVEVYDQNKDLGYCERCGEQIICKCPSCKKIIKGSYESDGFVAVGFRLPVPNYCPYCGAAYPWTEDLINSSVEILDLDIELSEEDIEVIKNAIPYLIVESPKTYVESSKFKKYYDKASEVGQNTLMNLLSDAIAGVAKKLIFG